MPKRVPQQTQNEQHDCKPATELQVQIKKEAKRKDLGVNGFNCSVNCFVLFNQLHGSFRSDATQRIAIVAAEKNA